jgi:FAD/FMN-containing dehydrogenase
MMSSVSVRGGGHNVAGRPSADGALMIDLSAMRRASIRRA